MDDVLGLFGDPKRGGAEDISDLREGKRTMLVIDALRNCSFEDSRLILEGLGNPKLTLKDASRIRDIISASGAVERSRGLASRLTNDGTGSLDGAGLDPDVCRALRGIADDMLNRI
jgi:geranylgeranyl diphosphate synthase type I